MLNAQQHEISPAGNTAGHPFTRGDAARGTRRRPRERRETTRKGRDYAKGQGLPELHELHELPELRELCELCELCELPDYTNTGA
jgi:hypothetical protein